MRAWKLLTLFLLAGCAAEAQQASPVSVTFQNGSERPLRCLLVFAHWTTIDLPVLQPGGSTAMTLYRAADRALFLPRAGEVQRRALALATILEPLLIVGMGGIVMMIVLAVLLPIIQLNTWVK